MMQESELWEPSDSQGTGEPIILARSNATMNDDQGRRQAWFESSARAFEEIETPPLRVVKSEKLGAPNRSVTRSTSRVASTALRSVLVFLPLAAHTAARGVAGACVALEGSMRTGATALEEVAENASEGLTQSAIAAIEALERAFRDSVETVFEDGVASDFSQTIQALVRTRPDAAFPWLAQLAASGERARQVSEVARWIGELRDQPTAADRRTFLAGALRSPSSVVRDGAVLGLSFLEDPEIVPLLSEAAKREPVPELRRDIESLVDELDETQPAPVT